MKSYIIIFFVVLLASCFTYEATAQSAPGLYGKRFFVEFGSSVMNNNTLNRYNENDKEPINSNVRALLLYSYNLQLNGFYALSRLRMIGGGVTYSRLGFGANEYPTSINANVNSLLLNVYVRDYSLGDGSIAPLGPYFQYGVSAVFNNRFFRQSTSAYTNPENFGAQSYISPAINMEWGNTTVVKDKLLFTFATQSTIILPYGIDTHSKEQGIEGIIIRGQSDSMYNRIFTHYMIRFKIAVGLPFKVKK